MRIGDFLQSLRGLGIELTLEDGSIRCNAPRGVMTPQLQSEIRQRKQEILEWLSLAAADVWSPLVAIQPQGDRTPFFCFHGVGGNVLNYRVLVQHLDPRQPLYGLQARGIDGLTPPSTDIPSMASLYLASIQRLQPRGPYLLGGGSMGGAVALEVARQLQALGERIDLLLLIDTLGPHCRPAKRLSELDQWRRRPLSILSDLQARTRAKLTHVVRRRWRIFRCRRFLRRRVPIPHELRFWYVEHCHYQALRTYHCRSYEGRLTLIRGDLEPDGWFSDPERGWSGVATEGLEVIAVPGDHTNLIEQPLLGQAIRRCLETLPQEGPAGQG